jgi:glyoxylate reductase
MATKPRVFVTRSLPGEALAHLARHADVDLWAGEAAPTPAELSERSAGAAALLCLLSDRISSELLEKCPHLRVVSSCSVGVDHIDLAAATARGIPVGHTPGVLVETTADLAFGLLLAAARRIPEADRFVRSGEWGTVAGWDPALLLGRDVHGATLGVIGLGAIGRAVARRAAGFGMRCLGWTRSGRGPDGVEMRSLEALLDESDFVTIHVAATPDTRGLVGARELARLRPGAILVNTARGGIVDEVALEAALRSGHLAAAALDVYATEPLPRDSPLLEAPNLVLTPHIGSASLATRARMAELAVDNVLAGLDGRPLPYCANPEVARGD